MARTPFYLNSLVDLKNASNSALMSVNGALSQQQYSYSPVNKSVWLVSLNLVINDNGTNGLTNFGAIAGLSSGILIESITTGVAHSIMTIKTNYQILSFFNQMTLSNGSSNLVGDDGFGASKTWAKATLDLRDNKIILTDSDSIRATIRDDLRSIDLLTMSCRIAEEI